MKKTLRTWLSLMGVALLATSMKVYAEGETLTEVWKQTDIPGHADARQGSAYGGKIYVQDKGAKKIYVMMAHKDRNSQCGGNQHNCG
ncbi:MAG: hypothetical protein ACLSG8_06075 [Barnesiella sp.]